MDSGKETLQLVFQYNSIIKMFIKTIFEAIDINMRINGGNNSETLMTAIASLGSLLSFREIERKFLYNFIYRVSQIIINTQFY